MAQRRALLHAVGAVTEDHDLALELFNRGWDVIEADCLLPIHGLDVAVLIHPGSEHDVMTAQARWANNLAMRDGILLVVSGMHLDLTECTRTNVTLAPSTIRTTDELASYINGLPLHDAPATNAVPPREAIHRLEDILNGMKRTARERHDMYGDSFLTFGRVAAALWPAGLSVGTEEEFARLGVLVQIIGKLCRYSVSPQGHVDSAHDMAVYSAILELLTEDLAVPPGAQS